MTTFSPTILDRLLFDLSPQQLKIERRKFVTYSLRSFVLVNVKLVLSALSLLFQGIRYVALRLRIAATWMRLKRLEKFRNDKRVIRLYRRLDSYQYERDAIRTSINSETRAWFHRLVFEWRTRIRFFWSTLASFRRSLRGSKQLRIGSHSAPEKIVIPLQRYAAMGILLVITLGLAIPSFTSKTANAKSSVLTQNEQNDLAIPVWASSVGQWKNLVRQVSHNSNVVVVRNGTQTNILSETVSTVNNTGQTVNQRYTPGQERLLYLLILVGSNGSASHKNGLCPLDPAQRRKILSQIGVNGSSVGSNVDGKEGAENSLILCGYLVNSLADQLVNINPAGQQRYAQHGPTQLAYDLAYNWVEGSPKSKKAYAATFARLYADWNKPASPTYAKLRKG
jgi:hypothetical protein